MTVSCPPPSAGRGTGVISVAGARPVVPASYVPEDLVAQAQTVLQGKSRNLIIRELQVRAGEDGEEGAAAWRQLICYVSIQAAQCPMLGPARGLRVSGVARVLLTLWQFDETWQLAC